MKKNILKITMACFTLLLIVSLTACKKDKTLVDQEISNPEVVVDSDSSESNGSKMTDVASVDGEVKIYPEGSVSFETEHSYSKLLKLFLSLPEGVKAADISDITFEVNTEMPLELRLYAGAKDVQKSASSEVTGSLLEALTELQDSNKKTVDGVEIDHENYDITLEAKNSTRAYLVEGEGQKVTFTFDGKGKEYLASIEGESIVFGLYANNVAPKYTIYSLSFQAAGQSYELTLDETTVKASQGSAILFH